MDALLRAYIARALVDVEQVQQRTLDLLVARTDLPADVARYEEVLACSAEIKAQTSVLAALIERAARPGLG